MKKYGIYYTNVNLMSSNIYDTVKEATENLAYTNDLGHIVEIIVPDFATIKEETKKN